MQRWCWPSAVVRLGVWVVVGAATVRLVRNPTPTIVDVLSALPFVLLFTSLPWLLAVWLVRTWWGTAIVGVAMTAIQLSLVALVAEAGRASSTAGVGVSALPVLLLLPVAVTYRCERGAASRSARRPPTSPVVDGGTSP